MRIDRPDSNALMRRYQRSVLFFVVAALACALPAIATATELVFANGDRITGKVIKKEDGKVYFHSDVLGDIVAPLNQVTIVEPPPPTAIAQSLAGLPPAPPKPPPPPVAVPPAYSGWWFPWWVTRPFWVLKPVVTHWTGKVELGYDNDLTTTRVVTTTARFQADKTVGPNSFELKGDYLYGSSDGAPTTDQDAFDFRWRHQLDDRLFTQLTTSYSSDKIRLINDDIEEEAALGYKLYADAHQTFDVGGGFTGQYLDATGVEKGVDYLANIFQDYTYKINSAYTLSEEASADYSPDRRGVFGIVGNLSLPAGEEQQIYDYKFQTSLQGKITNHLSINLHFEYDYDTAVLIPSTRAEQHIATTLGYAF